MGSGQGNCQGKGTFEVHVARFGVFESCVQLEEAPRKLQSTPERAGDAQPLKGAYTPFWESGKELEEPGKGEESMGKWRKILIPFFTLTPKSCSLLVYENWRLRGSSNTEY